jgi:hypothetical protein
VPSLIARRTTATATTRSHDVALIIFVRNFTMTKVCVFASRPLHEMYLGSRESGFEQLF